MDLPTGLFTGLGQGFEKSVAIPVVPENFVTAVAAIHDMVDRAGVLNSQFPRHGVEDGSPTGFVSIVMTDPFSFS